MARQIRGALGGLALLAWTAGAGTVGVPFLVNPGLVVGGQPNDQWDHQAASDSNLWLAVWADSWTAEIAGMRLDAQGRPLDPVALPIAPNGVGYAATERRYPTVAWFQDAFWVVWQEYRGSGLREGYGRRVAPDGTFVDVAPFRTETSSSSAYRSAVCAGGTNLLMTWSTYSSGYRLWAQPYSPEGEATGMATQLLSGLSGYVQPGMAFGDFSSGPKSFLLTFSLNSDIRGVRVSEGGIPLDVVPLALCTNAGTQSGPCPAFGQGPGGTQGWWVAWTDARGGVDDIYGTFVAQDGTVSHSSTGMALIAGDDDQFNPSLCGDGSRYLLCWDDARAPSAVRASVMDTDGVFADTNGTLVSTNEQYTPLVCARTNGHFLAVHGYESVFVETLDAQGSVLTVGTQRLVSIAGAAEQYNSGGCDGTNYWVAFEYHPAETERQGDVALQRLAADGTPGFAAPVLVCTNAADQWAPAAAVGRDTVYAVWNDERHTRDQVWGQRLDHGGQPLGTNVQIGTSTLYAYFCDIASDGTNFFAVWDDSGGDRMQGRFLNADGSMGSVITVFDSEISDPFVTFGGGVYLALWMDYNNDYVGFRRYRPDGTPVDASNSNLYSSSSGCWDPRAAYNPENNRFLVTWRDQATYQVLGRTLEASTAAFGNVVTVLVINAWASSENCAVAHDGTDWLCLLRDTRGGPNGLHGVRVAADATVLDATPFPVLGGAAFGALVPPAAPCTNVLVLGSRKVYDLPAADYGTRKCLGVFWQPGAQPATGQDLEAEALRVGPHGSRTLYLRHSAPGSTGYDVEACADLAAPDWRAITNGAFLDSGAGVSAHWIGPAGPESRQAYRVTVP
ncbi:MAG: hypothetical protein KA248_07265 [Kiritimatiellae bacterium]|nr:hypothetical protein [Kiritimatiellia bacterium]